MATRETCVVCGGKGEVQTWETGMLLCIAHALAWTRSEEKRLCRVEFEAAAETKKLPDFEVKVVTARSFGKEETTIESREGGRSESVTKTPEEVFELSLHFVMRARRSEGRLGFFWRRWYSRDGWTIPWGAEP